MQEQSSTSPLVCQRCGKPLPKLAKKYCSKTCVITKHGGSYWPEYAVWEAMKQRCNNPNHPVYRHYGGRGIRICERWMTFSNFIDDIGRRPEGDYTLERVDNSGNYEPDNCKWATRGEQMRNTRSTHFITIKGETKALTDWANHFGIDEKVVSARIRDGWHPSRSLTTPVSPSEIFLKFKGVTKSIVEWCKVIYISYAVIKSRLRSGWDIEKTLSTPSRSHWRTLTYHGKTMTISEWGASVGLSKYVIINRINAGWTTEEILTTPLGVRTRWKR